MVSVQEEDVDAGLHDSPQRLQFIGVRLENVGVARRRLARGADPVIEDITEQNQVLDLIVVSQDLPLQEPEQAGAVFFRLVPGPAGFIEFL